LSSEVKRAAWRPLLEGAIGKEATEAAKGVAAEIERPRRQRRGTRRRPEPSLAGGAAGIAVLYAYLGQAGFGSRYESASRHFLEEAGEAVGSVTMAPSLYGGFAGVAWAVAHLERNSSGSNGGESTEAVDEALKGYLNRRGWQGDYDLVSGLAGFGVYALERLPAPAAVACLEGVIDRLGETAERGSGGVTWHTAPQLLPPQQRELCPRGYYNFGLAHGVPGVIAVLGAACAAGVRRRKARRLLDGAVTWLLRQRRKDRRGSRFPAWAVPRTRSESCRSAWCYGDPGVATALFCAARSIGNEAWERDAVEIARRCAARPPDEAGVVDAGLCHGAAGLGHVFNRMYQGTGDTALRRAAQFWFKRTLAMRQPGRGVGGFSALAAKEDGTRYWEDDPGILTGAAGIALALLAATTTVEPEWDRMLLVSTLNSKPRRRSGKARRAVGGRC
jgi:lantibiotic modifying enzyme